MFGRKQPAQQAFARGVELESSGNLKDALKAYREAAEDSPHETRYLEAVGRVFESMGKMADATEWFMRAAHIERNADGGEPLHESSTLDPVVEAAWVHSLKPNKVVESQVTASIERVQALLSALGPDPTAYRKLALLFGRLGRIKEASEFFDNAAKAELRGMRWH
jgi:tetratricopeptide (TPR) repeat protein